MEQAQPAQRERSPSPQQLVDVYWPVLAHILGLSLALLAQRRLPGQVDSSIRLFAVALLCFLLPLALRPLSLRPQLEIPAPATRVPLATPFWCLLFALTSVVLAVLAFVSFTGNTLLPGFWYWLGAIFYFLLAFARRPAGSWRLALRRRWSAADRRVLLALVLITLVGAFFRAYRLDAVPAEMTSDHAEKLLDVYDVLHGSRPIFFTRNTGREMVQFYLTAALIKLTPLTLSHLALKVGTALVGIVTIPLTYFLGKELYGRAAGLLAACFLAISHWHVAITRVGLRFPFTAAFAVPAVFFLIRALRYNRRNDWLAAGLVLGAGLHTYTAMRIVPLLFLVFVTLRLAQAIAGKQPPLGRDFWINGLLGGALSLLLFLPLLRFLLDQPDLFWYRATSRAQDGLAPDAIARVFWQNLQDALLMFNYRGDVVPPNTIPGSPALGLVSGALLVLGGGVLLWRLLRHREDSAAYLLSAFFLLLLPSVLSLAYPEENPSVVRAGGAVPFVMIVVALPLVIMGRRCLSLPVATARWILALLLGGCLLFALVDNYHWYFVDYDRHIRRSLWNATQMGAVVRDFTAAGGERQDVYHVAYPHWVDTRAIAITAGDITWHNAILGLEQFEDHVGAPGPRLYLLYPRDADSLARLSALFPEGTTYRYRSDRPGKDFLLYRVPRGR